MILNDVQRKFGRRVSATAFKIFKNIHIYDTSGEI